jgi:hypothetical protein
MATGVGDDRWRRRKGGQAAAVVRKVVGLSTAVHASGDRTRLGLLFNTMIIGMRASYRRMAAGAHDPVG